MDTATEMSEMPDEPKRPDGLDGGGVDGPDQYELLDDRGELGEDETKSATSTTKEERGGAAGSGEPGGDRNAGDSADRNGSSGPSRSSDPSDPSASKDSNGPADDHDRDGDELDSADDTKAAAAVFVDPSGRRGRLFRPLGIAAGSLLAAYIVIVAFGLVTDARVPLTPWPDPKPSRDSVVPGQGRLMLKQGRPATSESGAPADPMTGLGPEAGAPGGSPSTGPTGRRTPGASAKPAKPTPKPSATVAPVPTPSTPKWPGWPWNTKTPKPKKG